MQQVVAAAGERLDDAREPRHADGDVARERQRDLADRRQPAVDVAVGPDHLDLEARNAAFPQLLERARHPVGGADAVGHQRDPGRLAVGALEPALLAAEEGGRGRVRHRGDAGLEDLRGGRAPVAAGALGGDLDHASDRRLELAVVVVARAPEQLRVAEAVGLHEVEQLALGQVEVDRGEPGAQQRPRVVGAEVGGRRAARASPSAIRRSSIRSTTAGSGAAPSPRP